MENLIKEIAQKKKELNDLYKQLDNYAKDDFNKKYEGYNYKFDYSSINKNNQIIVHYINENKEHDSYII